MPVCDLCNKEKDEVFKPTFKILYAKDKDISEVKFCKECTDFITMEDQDEN